MGQAPRLIASDIDGTLLNSSDRVPREVREVIARATQAGTQVCLATGRPHRWIGMVLDQLPIRPLCVTSNGAVLYDSATQKVLERHELLPETMAEVVEAASCALRDHGGVAIGAERVPARIDAPEEEAFIISPGYFHTWEEQGFGTGTEEEVISQPAVKLILRNASMKAPQMFSLIAPYVDSSKAHLTYSMHAGLLEVAAPGVNKALGVAELARRYGVGQDEVIAFGDMPNDIEMLSWAGTGVAMGNAATVVKEAADIITTSNDEAGLAHVLQQWF